MLLQTRKILTAAVHSIILESDINNNLTRKTVKNIPISPTNASIINHINPLLTNVPLMQKPSSWFLIQNV